MKKRTIPGKSEGGMKSVLAVAFIIAACGLPAAMATTVTLSPDQDMRRTDEYYNIKVPNSSLRLGFTGTFQTGWDSNIGQSGYGKGKDESGFFMQPGLTMAVDWPISPYFTVHSEAGVAYRYYFGGKGRNDFILSGDSGGINTGFSGELKLGQTGKLTFGDNISRTIESLQYLAATNGQQQRYSTTTNETFLQYENDLNETLHTVDRYAHTISWHSPGTYKYLDSQSDMGDFLLLRDMWKGGQVGPYFTVTDTYYSSAQQGTNTKRNGDIDYKFGLAFRHIGPITISGRAGWEIKEFDSTTATTDQSSQSGPTYSLDVVFGTGSNIIHRFSSSYGLDTQFLATTTNSVKQWQNTYSVNWRLRREWILGGDVSWLKRTSAGGGDSSDIIQFGIGPTYEMSQRTQLSLRYQYTKKLSDQTVNDYDRHMVTFTLTHKF